MTRRLCLLPLVTLACALPLLASAPPQCTRATLSHNAHVLVLNDLTHDDATAVSNPPSRSVFQVFTPLQEASPRLRFHASETAWSAPLWQVAFTSTPDSPGIPACSSVLVTGDAEFLVLIGNGSAALTIYRRRDHPGRPLTGPGPDPGVLVRQISADSLGLPVSRGFNETTKAWYADGRFRLTRWTLTVSAPRRPQLRIDLASGSITSARP